MDGWMDDDDDDVDDDARQYEEEAVQVMSLRKTRRMSETVTSSSTDRRCIISPRHSRRHLLSRCRRSFVRKCRLVSFHIIVYLMHSKSTERPCAAATPEYLR